MKVTEKTKTINDLTLIRNFVGFIAIVIVAVMLRNLKNIFIPLFTALLLYFLFNGAVKKLGSWKIPKPLILTALLIFIFIIFYFFGVLMYASVSTFIETFPTYSGKLQETLKSIFNQLNIPISDFNNYIAKIDWTKNLNPSSITGVLSTTFGSFTSFIGYLTLVLLFLMFMLAGKENMTIRFAKAFEEKDKNKNLLGLFDTIEGEIRHYLLIKTFLSLISAVICGIILLIGGFDFVILVSLVTFILNFIPEFGSVVATIFPITLGLLKFGLSARLFLVMGALIVSQFIIGNILEPKITGKQLDLSPIAILIALVFWGYLWGIVGAFLAVPLTSAIKIFLQHIDALKPIGKLISAE